MSALLFIITCRKALKVFIKKQDVLEEMEKKLAEDHIYPVQIREKRVGLLRKKAGMETVKVHLRRPEVCNGLDAASRDYSAGFTAPHIDFETGSDFAYFLTDENQEGK